MWRVRIGTCVAVVMLQTACFDARRVAGRAADSGAVTPDTAAACASLMPGQLGTPQVAQRSVGVGDCGPLDFDGQGDVLIVTWGVDWYDDCRFEFVSRDGVSTQYPVAVDGRLDVLPQAAGFEIIEQHGYQSDPALIDATGAVSPLVAPAPRAGAFAARDPLGGMLVWFSDTPHVPHAVTGLFAYDASGAERWSLPMAPAGDGGLAAIGVDRGGATLLLFWHGGANDPSLTALWVDHAGKAGPPFRVPLDLQTTEDVLVDAADGGLFLHVTYIDAQFAATPAWAYWFPSMSPRAEPVPDWLAARPAAAVYPIRSGAGFAAVSPGPDGGCTPTVEILTSQGDLCGALSFPPDPSTCGAQVTLGIDGTLQQGAGLSSTPQGASTCAWWYWPGLLH